MNKKIEELLVTIPFFKEMSEKDAEINVWNTEGVIVGYFPSSTIQLPFNLGFELTDKNDPLFEVLKTGKQKYVSLPAEVFGESIEGYITPIKDGIQVVGCVTYVFSSEHTKQIANRSESLNQLLQSSYDALSNIWTVFNSVTNNIKTIHDVSKEINTELGRIQQINDEIQKNAKYSNILALNASIESARVGAAGKGFAVVSEEMRNFAKVSSDSANSINTMLTHIVKILHDITVTVDETLSVSGTQYENVESAKKMLSDINVLSLEMMDLCKQF